MVITAAGNNNKDASGYFPANCKGVIAVAASTRQGTLAGYSNYGTIVTLSAPGGDSANPIMTLRVDAMETDLQIFNGVGTSFAVPHEAAILSLILHMGSIETYFTPPNEIDYAMKCGHGIVSIRRSIVKNYTETIKGLNPSFNMSDNNNLTYANNTVIADGIAITQICQQGTYANDDASIKWTKNTIPTGTGTYNIQCPGSQFIGSITKYSVCGVGIQVQCETRDGVIGQKSTCIGSGSCTGCTNSEISYGAPVAVAYTPNGYYIVTIVYLDGIGYERVFYDPSFNFGGAQNVEYCPTGLVVVGLYGTLTGTVVDSARIICRNMCPACPKGSYCTGGVSIKCSAGTYSNADGASSSSTCSGCPASTYSTALGAVSSDTCSKCVDGTYSSALGAVSSGSCLSCVAGFYYSVVGTSAACLQCAAGKYSTLLSAVSSATCSDCQAGTYSTVLGAVSSVTCSACRAGTYSSVVGVVSSALCSACTIGTYSTKIGATGSSTCQGCLPGTFSATIGLSICANCQIGTTYSSATYSTSCLACSNNRACLTYQRLTACTLSADTNCYNCAKPDNSGWIVGDCVWQCDAGFYKSGNSCISCAVGTYSLVAGLTSPCTSACAPCDTGQYSSCGGSSSGGCVACSNSNYFGSR